MGILDFARVAFPDKKVSAELREVFGYAGRPLANKSKTIEQVVEEVRGFESLPDEARWVITQSEDDRLAMGAVLVRLELSDGSLSSRMDQLCNKIHEVDLKLKDSTW